MMFWFKKKKIVVDCFTNVDSVFDLYKIRKAAVYYPEDIKSMSPTTKIQHPNTKIDYTVSTIKMCNGINDMYKRGHIIPFWSDFISQPKRAWTGEAAIAMMGDRFNYDSHPKDQYVGLYKDYMHVKIHSPWYFREKTGVRFLWKGADWNLHNFSRNFTIPSATLWFKDQGSTNINMFIHKDSDDFILKGGTPIIHLVPLTEDTVEFKCHLVDGKDMESFAGIPPSYGMLKPGRYTNYVKEKALSHQLDEMEKQKCPFGFGR